MLNEQLREQLEEKNKTIEAERNRFKELQDQVNFAIVISNLFINQMNNL